MTTQPTEKDLELILAVDRDYLFDNERLAFQGVTKDPKHIREINKRLDGYMEVYRGPAEKNTAWKQPIPYAIIRRGDEVFLYERLSKSGEERLHGQLSIGVGGHMNKVNDVRNWDDTLAFNLYREIEEELIFKVSMDYTHSPKTVGLINDDENAVGKVHICILVVLDLPEDADVEVRETDKLDGYWVRIQDLKKTPLFERLESWSQIATEVL